MFDDAVPAFFIDSKNMETFQQIIEGEIPVLVDFYATWCAPCKTMSPVIEAVGKDLENKIRILKIDVDKNQNAAIRFGIQSVPTFIVFRSGKILWRQSGVVDKYSLKRKLEEFL